MNIHNYDNVLSDGRESKKCSPKGVVKIAAPFKGRRLDCDTTTVLLKIVLAGKVSCGISSLRLRICQRGLRWSNLRPTMFKVSFSQVKIDLDDVCVKFLVWDPDAAPQNCRLLPSYYRGADGFILAFNIADRESFDDLSAWYQRIVDHATCDFCVLLVGTMCDLKDRREVNYVEAKEFATTKGMAYIEVSAKDETNIELILPTLAALIGEVSTTKNTPYIQRF